MNKRDLIELFRYWRENDESEKIIDAILKLPDSALDDDYLAWLADAYINVEEYKKAIAVLEGQRERLDGDYKWHFRMGLALYHASSDEECEDDDDLMINILNRAKVAFARGMNMNPPPAALDTADLYMEKISERLDELCGDEEYEDGEPEDYDIDDADAIEEHIKEYYGDFPTVFRESGAPDINCDICVIPPTKERNYFTLVTVGMGAHIMNLPREITDPEELERTELVMCLPPNWKVGESSDEWFWPFTLLSNLARLPITCSTWLGWGHSVDNQEPFAPNTKLCGSLLLYPSGVSEDADSVTLPSGIIVNFLEVIPLYREEIDYKIDFDTAFLLNRMTNCSHIVDINRPNTCEGYISSDSPIIDCADDHSSKIRNKHLPLDENNGANHIAIFLRWCMEHGLVEYEFTEAMTPSCYKDLTALRAFILGFMGGNITTQYFTYLGTKFVDYYYDWDIHNPEHFYPADVDSFAEDYFGTERFNSDEFLDEAYLFIPYNEEYYNGISKYIEKAYEDFLVNVKKECAEKNTRLINAVNKHLDARLIPLPAEEEKLRNVPNTDFPRLIAIGNVACDSTDGMIDLFGSILSADRVYITLATSTVADGREWLNKQFQLKGVVENVGERVIELYRKAAELLGSEFSMMSFGNSGTVLLIPRGDGSFDCYTGRGINT